MKPCIVIIGVSGCGKTTVGLYLSKALALPFYDADDFHPTANKDKMAQGMPLTDLDRKPWLNHLSTELNSWQLKNGAVLACSALKESYRQVLSKGSSITWVYLKGEFDTIRSRMESRNHFMPPELLSSQFEALEEPLYGIHCGIEKTPEEIVNHVINELEK